MVLRSEVPLSGKRLAVLRVIGESGVASLLQLHTHFWPHTTEKAARRALLALEKLGYLQPAYTDVRGTRELIFSLTGLAVRQFGNREQARLLSGFPKYNELRQQLLVQETRLLVERKLAERGAKLVEWRNEHLLRSLECKRQMEAFGISYYEVQLQDIPDAQAVIEEADGLRHEISIEADGAYYGATLEGKLATIRRNSSQHWLWVTYSGRRAARLAGLLQELPNVQLVRVELRRNSRKTIKAQNEGKSRGYDAEKSPNKRQ